MTAMNSTAPCPEFVQKLQTLPPEIRLDIFQRVFWKRFRRRDIIDVKKVNSVFIFFPNRNCERDKLEWTLPYIQPEHVGRSIAAEAAEALYSSQYKFQIGAELLPEFLAKCPISQGVRPGNLIRKLLLNVDEDAHFVGEGSDKQGLRKADWVILDEEEPEYERQPGKSQRNVLMRKCWKAILTMPHLCWFEVHIMPAEGLLPLREVKFLEVRDIAPSMARLWAKGVTTTVYLCVLNEYKPPPKGSREDCIEQILGRDYDSIHDISRFFPTFSALHDGLTDDQREVVRALEPSPASRDCWKHRGFPYRDDLTFDQKRIFHQFKIYDGLTDLFDRLEVDKSVGWVNDDFRKVRTKRQLSLVASHDAGLSAKKKLSE